MDHKYIEEIKKIKDDWLNQNSFFQRYRKQHWKKEDEDVQTLITGLLSVIKELKESAPEEFEVLYWQTHVHIIRDTMYRGSYAGMIAILSLIISILSMIYTIGEAKISSGICGIVAAALVLFVIFKERRALFATRERAYEQILYLILEDIRKKNAA